MSITSTAPSLTACSSSTPSKRPPMPRPRSPASMAIRPILVSPDGRECTRPVPTTWPPLRATGLCTKSRIAGPWFDRLTTNVASNPPFVLSLSKGNSRYAALLVQSRATAWKAASSYSSVSSSGGTDCSETKTSDLSLRAPSMSSGVSASLTTISSSVFRVSGTVSPNRSRVPCGVRDWSAIVYDALARMATACRWGCSSSGRALQWH